MKNMQTAFPDASEESRHALALGQPLALGELKRLRLTHMFGAGRTMAVFDSL